MEKHRTQAFSCEAIRSAVNVSREPISCPKHVVYGVNCVCVCVCGVFVVIAVCFVHGVCGVCYVVTQKNRFRNGLQKYAWTH